MSVAHGEPRKVVDITEKDDSLGVVEYTMGARGISRISMQAIFAGYTGVNVKMQSTLDDVTWSDVSAMAIGTSGDIVSQRIGPFSQIRIFVTATLSGGADTLETFLMVEFAPK